MIGEKKKESADIAGFRSKENLTETWYWKFASRSQRSESRKKSAQKKYDQSQNTKPLRVTLGTQ